MFLFSGEKIVANLEKGQNGRYSRLWPDKDKDGKPDVIENNGWSTTLRDGYLDKKEAKRGRELWEEKFWCTYLPINATGLAGVEDKGLRGFEVDMNWTPKKGTFNHKSVIGLHKEFMKRSQNWEEQQPKGLVNQVKQWVNPPDSLHYTLIDYDIAPSQLDALQKVRPGDVMFMERKRLKLSDQHVVIVKDKQIEDDGSGKIEVIQSNALKKSEVFQISKGGKIEGTPYPVRAFGGIRFGS